MRALLLLVALTAAACTSDDAPPADGALAPNPHGVQAGDAAATERSLIPGTQMPDLAVQSLEGSCYIYTRADGRRVVVRKTVGRGTTAEVRDRAVLDDVGDCPEPLTPPVERRETEAYTFFEGRAPGGRLIFSSAQMTNLPLIVVDEGTGEVLFEATALHGAFGPFVTADGALAMERAVKPEQTTLADCPDAADRDVIFVSERIRVSLADGAVAVVDRLCVVPEA